MAFQHESTTESRSCVPTFCKGHKGDRTDEDDSRHSVDERTACVMPPGYPPRGWAWAFRISGSPADDANGLYRLVSIRGTPARKASFVDKVAKHGDLLYLKVNTLENNTVRSGRLNSMAIVPDNDDECWFIGCWMEQTEDYYKLLLKPMTGRGPLPGFRNMTWQR